MLSQASPETGDEEEPALPVEVVEASYGNVELTISFTGVLEPEMSVNVVHKTGGKVAEVRVKDGSQVRSGDVLIRLDAAEISAQVAQAEAALLMAQVQFETAAQALEDTRALYEEEIVSRQQFEQAETQYKVAEAQLAQAEAALQLARTYLDDTVITAPIGGTISGLSVNPGEIIAPGVPVAIINKMDTMEVSVQLTEKDVGRIAVGQEVGIEISAVSSELLEGEVTSISPVADPRTKTYEMKAALPNEGGRLKAGMTATIHAVVAAEKETVVVPVDAVLTQQGEQVVYIVEDGVAYCRPVTLGLENGSEVSVLEGLSPGEQVVVKGQHYLQDGGKVAVVGGGTAQ
ncbi:MAG TPA: efflux RND transporter periplasmic adaptor subunit [Bacillota bacterium]|nr:efflux RND transporter periplasmic adaptor subunit [Bacillota bacterium]